MPWLALILLQDDEWTDASKVAPRTLAWEDLRKRLGLTEEATDAPPDNQKPYPPVKVLQIEKNFLGKIMPTPEDLPWLSHVRAGQDAERAVLVCNRMPRAGARAAVHLVSLEQRLTPEGRFDDQKGAEAGKIPLLSLYSWQFTCPADEQYKASDKAIGRLPSELQTKAGDSFPSEEDRDQLYRGSEAFTAALKEKGFDDAEIQTLVNLCRIQTETFKGLMDALNLGWLHLPLPVNQGTFFEMGSIPLAHGLRKGGKTASWYHGPLVPDKSLSAAAQETIREMLPVRNADQLLLYNLSTGMLDASYAAAWELGRLITVSEPAPASRSPNGKPHTPGKRLWQSRICSFHTSPLPIRNSFTSQRGFLAGKLQQYFMDLSQLKAVPFHYLIPHERLLPDEAMRFFYIDPLWIDCLLDGAFSIGRTTQYDRESERSREGDPHQASRTPMMGVLLRSDLVSGWPALRLDGYGGNKRPLDNLRFERLGPNVLLVVFAGEIESLALYLPPESLHFGFSRDASDENVYDKEVKSLTDGHEILTGDGRSMQTAVSFGWRPGAEALRIFVPERMKDNINDCLAEAKLLERVTHSGHLAIQLLEGAPRLQVSVKKA